MQWRLAWRGKMFLGLALVLLLFGAAVWWQRAPLLARYYVHGLTQASDADRAVWAEKTAALEETALPALLPCLERPDPAVCANVRTALVCLLRRRAADDPRTIALFGRLADNFTPLSMCGQRVVLELAAEWLQAKAPPGAVVACGRFLAQASRSPDAEVRNRGLALARLVVSRKPPDAELAVCRQVVQTGLQDQDAVNRVDAIRQAVLPEIGLCRQVVPLLDDPVSDVRVSAMLAVGALSETDVPPDDLLRSLHDPDPDVRRLCEVALRARRLRPIDLTLGRLITDPQPSVRLQVLEKLGRADLEPGVWLRRLSQDPAPAVRAAALRAAAQAEFEFGDRLEVMAQTDPSPTVRQLAQHYLFVQKNRQQPPMPR